MAWTEVPTTLEEKAKKDFGESSGGMGHEKADLVADVAVRMAKEVEELVDIEKVSEEHKEALWLFGSKEAEGSKHRMVRGVQDKKKFQCTRCSMRSLKN